MVARPEPYPDTPDAPSDTSVNPRPRQMTLPGMEPSRPSLGGGIDDPSTPDRETTKVDALAEYETVLPPDRDRTLDAPNPLHRPKIYDEVQQQSTAHYMAGRQPGRFNEFVEPHRVHSEQERVSSAAIDHQVKHANPLALTQDPEMTSFTDPETGEESFMVYDGNHRVNAAQRRGQLLMPANVARYNAPNYHRGPNSVRRSRA